LDSFEVINHIIGTSNSAAASASVEISIEQLISKFVPGDILVINDTKVLRRRVFTANQIEILFLNECAGRVEANAGLNDAEFSNAAVTGAALDDGRFADTSLTIAPNEDQSLQGFDWEVLCPARKWKKNAVEILPDGTELRLLQRSGRPQKVRASRRLTSEFFEKYGELPLPPYIQKQRDDRHNRSGDKTEYQTAWAENPGSFAAPTASLHFSNEHLRQIEARGVKIARVTLHVGLGTFLPIETEDLSQHIMHHEWVDIPKATVDLLTEVLRGRRALRELQAGPRVWALGTTALRSVESWARGGHFQPTASGGVSGQTNLFIKPGDSFQVVSGLLTNFHQPKTTLLALLAAFAGDPGWREGYRLAIEKKFRLFSYGDLTVWVRSHN
jgi:S-adenosylmethionine:tRNA ribosyltransferase-isomerase